MSERKHRGPSIRQRIDDEFDEREVHFSEALHSRVTEAIHTADRPTDAPTQRGSFWSRQVSVPIPLLLIPVLILTVFGVTVVANSRSQVQNPAERLVVTQSGSVYTLSQLQQGGGRS